MQADDDYMEEEELRSYDCGVACIMIGLVPLLIYYVFFNRNLLAVGTLAGGVLIASLVVFLLSAFTGWVGIGRVINLLGSILTPIYLYFAYAIWDHCDAFDMPKDGETRELFIPMPWED